MVMKGWNKLYITTYQEHFKVNCLLKMSMIRNWSVIFFHAFNQLVTSWQTKIPWFARNVSEFRMLVLGLGESVIHVIHVSFLRWVYRINVSVIRLSKSDVAWVDTNEWPGSCLSHHLSHHTKPNVSLSNVSSSVSV